MRRLTVAFLLVVAALAGGVAAVGVGSWAGWIGGDNGGPTVVLPATEAADGLDAESGAAAAITSSGGDAFAAAAIYKQRSSGVVTIFATFPGDGATAQGSGFVVAGDGTILTSAHVITDAGTAGTSLPARAASRIFVEFADRDRIPATIVGWDVFSDVGVIRVDPKLHALLPVPLGRSALVQVGDPVAAIGSPFGNEGSLSVGVVSAVRRSVESLTSAYNLVDAIQTDAPINHGNSGGPLFDRAGRVIGINAQIRSTSGSAEGVGFAVPIDIARRALGELTATGRVRYAFVGIRSEDLTPAVARALRYAVAEGAVIERVDAGTAAAVAGLRGGTRDATVNGTTYRVGGDIIVGIAGRKVRSSDDVARIIGLELRPGQQVDFAIVRDGKRLTLPVRLGERAAPSGG